MYFAKQMAKQIGVVPPDQELEINHTSLVRRTKKGKPVYLCDMCNIEATDAIDLGKHWAGRLHREGMGQVGMVGRGRLVAW